MSIWVRNDKAPWGSGVGRPSDAAVLPSPSTTLSLLCTLTVHDDTRSGQRKRQLSPSSTALMTTYMSVMMEITKLVRPVQLLAAPSAGPMQDLRSIRG
jgi:hypothetical protein